jgi:hypothetical protein
MSNIASLLTERGILEEDIHECYQRQKEITYRMALARWLAGRSGSNHRVEEAERTCLILGKISDGLGRQIIRSMKGIQMIDDESECLLFEWTNLKG